MGGQRHDDLCLTVAVEILNGGAADAEHSAGCRHRRGEGFRVHDLKVERAAIDQRTFAALNRDNASAGVADFYIVDDDGARPSNAPVADLVIIGAKGDLQG